MTSPLQITCWDVKAGRKCPRGILSCKYCQDDAKSNKVVGAAQKLIASRGASSTLVVPHGRIGSASKASTVAVALSLSQQKTVTLFNFSDELKALDQAELTERVKVELEAFGEIVALRFSPGMVYGDKRLFAYYKTPDSAADAVKGLADTPFDIPFNITLGVVMGTGETKTLVQKAFVPPKSCKVTIYVDELPMPKRPAVEPSLTDSEVWIDPMPDEDLEEWCSAFGAVANIFRIPTPPGPTGQQSHKGYVKFKEHAAAKACVEAGAGSWSESERALSWQRGEKSPAKDHTYPYSLVSALIGDKGAGINSLRLDCGVWGMKIGGLDFSPKAHRLSLEAEGDQTNIVRVRPLFEKRLTEIHEEISDFLSQQGEDISQGRAGRVMQDGLVLPKWSWYIHIDELNMPERPDLEPVSTDREVWVPTTPSSEEFEDWKQSFGTIAEVFRVPSTKSDNEKGYVLFETHEAAKACVDLGVGVWSESERALAWQGRNSAKGPRTYPTSIVSWFLRNNGEHIRDVANKCGILHLKLSGDESLGDANVSKRLHFVVEGGRKVSLESIQLGLEEKLAKLHKEMLYYKHDDKDERRDGEEKSDGDEPKSWDERRDWDEKRDRDERRDWDNGGDSRPPRKRQRPGKKDRQKGKGKGGDKWAGSREAEQPHEDDDAPVWAAPVWDEPAWQAESESGKDPKRPRPTQAAKYSYSSGSASGWQGRNY